MAFGMEDTARLCRQYRDAMREEGDGQYRALSDRLYRVEQAIRFIAAMQSKRGLTEDEIAQLKRIAKRPGGVRVGALSAAPIHGSR